MHAHGGEHAQGQHSNRGALQHPRIVGVAQARPLIQAQRGHSTSGDTGVTHFDRNHHAFGGVPQKESQTEKQQHHTDAQHRVTNPQPVFGGDTPRSITLG
jgi:hypothetical protein